MCCICDIEHRIFAHHPYSHHHRHALHEMTRDCALTNKNTINLWLFNATSAEQVGAPRRILTHLVFILTKPTEHIHWIACVHTVWRQCIAMKMVVDFGHVSLVQIIQTHSTHKIIIAAAYTRYRYRLWICNEMSLCGLLLVAAPFPLPRSLFI